MDRRAERIGGWGALGALVLSVALVGLVAAARIAVQGRGGGGSSGIGTLGIGTTGIGALGLDEPAVVALALALARVAFAVAVALSVRGVQAALAPSSAVTGVGTAAGWAGAAMLAASSAVAPFLPGPALPPWVGWTGYWAPLPLGVWLLCTAAAAWKLRRLPRWLRVAAAVEGAMLFMQPAIPELGVLVLLVGGAWWLGLGLALLSDAGRAPAR